MCFVKVIITGDRVEQNKNIRVKRVAWGSSVVYRKGELSPAGVDRGWPHQVALPASACESGGYKTIHDFCKDLSLCPRGHCVFHDEQWFNVYCFADAADAEKFMGRFGGEKFDPAQRGKGNNWMQWKK